MIEKECPKCKNVEKLTDDAPLKDDFVKKKQD